MSKQFYKNIRRYFVPVLVTGICMYAIYLRLVRLSSRKLWADEFHQLHQMGGSFFDMLKSLPVLEYCSYLSGDYYLTYPFFKIFSYNKWGLAIPHLIATIIGFYLLYLICKQYFKTFWGYIVTFSIVCFNATLIWHACEVRTYAVLPTLAAASLYLSKMLVDENETLSVGKKWGIGVFFVLLIWFHVYGILILFSTLSFFILAKLGDKSFAAIFLNIRKFMFIVFVISMPFWCISVFGPHFMWKGLNIDPFQFIPSPLINIKGFLKGVFGNLLGYKKLYFLMFAMVFPFIFPYKDRIKQIVFLFVSIFLPIGLIFFSDVMQKYWFIQRQFVWVMPLFAFFLGWSWDSFFHYIGDIRKRRFKEIRQ